eukprot:1192342-Prorocentrum_minimum.AAC.1
MACRRKAGRVDGVSCAPLPPLLAQDPVNVHASNDLKPSDENRCDSSFAAAAAAAAEVCWTKQN